MNHNLLYSGGTLGELIIAALNRFPESTAFICEDRQYTYRAVSERISRAIQLLKSLGLKKGDTIVQVSRNLPEQWFVMAACYLLGYKSVTLQAMGSNEDHAFTVNDGEAVVAVFDSYFSAKARDLKPLCPTVQHWFSHGDTDGMENFWTLASAFEAAPLVNETGPEDIIRLGYTGGTTGRPKGVILSSRSMLFQALLALLEKDWPQKPVFLCPAPISHGAGANIIPTLSRGGTFIVLPGFNVDRVLDTIVEHRVSVLYGVPTMLYALLDSPRTRQTDLSSLKSIMYGASPTSPTRIREAIEVFGPILCQTYGQTEAPSSITVLRQCDHDANDLLRLSSCGMAYPGIQVTLLDEHCKPVPDGEVGEVCVRGPIVMSGYWKQPELTAEAFKGDWLHTGDLAYRDAKGFYYIVDRKKDMIISGGFNVYPKEIEDILATHPGVSAVAIIGVPDDKWGEAVKAIIVPRKGMRPYPEELVSLVRDKKGPVYAPKSVEYVDSLPQTPVGKPDKAALRKKYWGGKSRAVN